MSNNYFQFKQFTIHQEHCAMRVSTDACILGAWTPVAEGVQTVLDIGTGTGLLSLMLAQRAAQIQVDAIELDAEAVKEARQNVLSSPWANRINIIEGDIRTWQAQHKYDLVICNPPFFNNSLLGPGSARNQARHTITLGYQDLFTVISALVAPRGYASILLPHTEHVQWETLLHQNGWSVFQKLHIIPVSGGQPNRVISLCSPVDRDTRQDNLIIRQQDNTYTDDFTALLRPYYLAL